MSSFDRLLGELLEFKRSTLQKLDTLDHNVRELNNFKWRVAGGAAVLSFLLVMVIEVFHFFKGGV